MDDTDYVMISALEHYAYCPRQCALIHLEQTFDENIYTLRGQRLHRRVDSPVSAEYEGVRVERAMPLWSERLGLIGKADMVEFRNETPHPVEYKSGKRRSSKAEKIQLCAQALCLEEMFDVSITDGTLYWIGSKRRVRVLFDDALRKETVDIIGNVRRMLRNFELPEAIYEDAKCRHCSLKLSCMPELEEFEKDEQSLLFGEWT